MKLIKYVILALFITVSTPAFAGKMMFGDNETIHKIQDINFQDKSGEHYYLGYKTTIKMVFAGVYLSDDGYVLGVREEYGKYIPLDTNKIASLQLSGLLPSPMPSYNIRLFDYALGYSLWILILLFGGYYLVKSLFNKRGAVS